MPSSPDPGGLALGRSARSPRASYLGRRHRPAGEPRSGSGRRSHEHARATTPRSTTGRAGRARPQRAELERIAPGLPAHRPRLTDIDPRAARRAERQVAILFGLSALATIGFCVAFVAFPDAAETITIIPGMFEPSVSNSASG